MSNPSDWNSDDDNDEVEDELEGVFEDEHEYDDEDDREYEEEEEEVGEGTDGGSEYAATTGGGCFRTMLLAMAFWMAVALAALVFCVVFGRRL